MKNIFILLFLFFSCGKEQIKQKKEENKKFVLELSCETDFNTWVNRQPTTNNVIVIEEGDYIQTDKPVIIHIFTQPCFSYKNSEKLYKRVGNGYLFSDTLYKKGAFIIE